MLVHHLRRWPNITPTQGECLVYAGQVVSGDDSVTETQSGVNDLSTWLSYCGQSVRPHSDCHAHTYTQYLWSSTITLLLWSLHSSSSIQLSATCRLLDITHMICAMGRRPPPPWPTQTTQTSWPECELSHFRQQSGDVIMSIHVALTHPFRTAANHICCQGPTRCGKMTLHWDKLLFT